MRTIRIHCPLSLNENTTVALTPEAGNHVARVLRAEVGDELHLFDGQGNEFSAAISVINPKSVTVQVGGRIANDTDSPLNIFLVQGVSRGERMDLAVQKSTELGVAGIIPVVTARSVVKLDRDQAAKRREHWLAISINACEQCGRARLPNIETPMDLATYLNKKAIGSPFRCVLDPTAQHSLVEIAERRIGDGLHEPRIELLIGPEGGLDGEEIAAAVAAGFVPVSLGPRILRTETAAVTALAVLQGCFGDLR